MTLRDAMFAALAARFRVIAPLSTSPAATVAPAGGSDSPFAHWLRGVLDGLGVLRAHLVVDAPLAAEALRFATANRTQIGRVVTLAHDAPERFPSDGSTLSLRADAGEATIAATLAFLTEGLGRQA